MTLHLLKQNAKPSQQRQTRKKYPALEFKQFPEEEKEEMMGAPDKEMGDESFRDITAQVKRSQRNKTQANQGLQ